MRARAPSARAHGAEHRGAGAARKANAGGAADLATEARQPPSGEELPQQNAD